MARKPSEQFANSLMAGAALKGNSGVPYHDLPDHTLAIMIRDNRDERASLILWKRYKEKIRTTLMKTTNNNAEAVADLSSKVFIKAIQNFGKGKLPRYFSSWISFITFRTGFDYLRKKGTRHWLVPWKDELKQRKAKTDTPEEICSRKQWAAKMRELVDMLKPRDRELIQLKFFRHRSYQEIAEIIEIPLGTVKAQLFRAKRRLCFLYKEHLNE